MLFGGIDIPGRPDLTNIQKLDLLPVPMSRRMSRIGFAIDPPYFADLTAQLTAEMQELEKDIVSYIPYEALSDFIINAGQVEEDWGLNVASSEQIGKLLFDTLHIGRGRERELKMTKGGVRISTGKKQLELVKADHPVVQRVLDYRERAKLTTTYTKALPKMAKWHPRSVGSSVCPVCEYQHVDGTWRVHTDFASTRAETGRLCSRRPNLANVPARTELGGLVRLGFVASPGTMLVSADLSQIELRNLAHCADAKSMIDIYEASGDIHQSTAMKAFGITDPSKVDKLKHRLPAKTIGFGLMYGMTSMGLQATLATMGLLWTVEECDVFVEKFFSIYPEVREYMELQAYRARRYGMVWDALGRVRLIPEVRSYHSWIRSAGLRQAGNFPIQALNAGQMKLAMGKADARLLELERQEGCWCVPLMTIYDQLIVEAQEGMEGRALEVLTETFNGVMDDEETGERLFRVPVESDGEVMARWVK